MRIKLTPFFHWIKLNPVSKPWLVVGKGPSFENISKINLNDYTVVGLNHVMFQIPCKFGHAIDLDVYDTDEKFKCEHLITPWEPHIDFKPGSKSLIDLMLESKLGHGSVLYYNSSRTKNKGLRTDGPVVKVRHFGSVAVMNLLAMSSCKEVFTIGVDGGSTYSSIFDSKNLLANGRKSFDAQFAEFSETTKLYGTKITPLF